MSMFVNRVPTVEDSDSLFGIEYKREIEISRAVESFAFIHSNVNVKLRIRLVVGYICFSPRRIRAV